MTFNSPQAPQDQPAPTEQRPGLRLPLARPIVTYVLLGILVLIFIADLVLTQLFGDRIVFILGAQWNQDVGAGWYWQLLTATFLHAGLTHLAFNGYALYVLGRDIESLYGSLWFTVLYFLAGLAGSAAWYVFGSADPSVGASGAIFGLMGAEAAFFLRNRGLFGSFARQRLRNVLVLLVINFIIGFTIPNINYVAHLGGLVAGFLVGLVLTPSYVVGWSQDGSGQTPRLVDTRTNGQRLFISALTLLILVGVVLVGNQRWAG
jgi:rhomboid protease GluP